MFHKIQDYLVIDCSITHAMLAVGYEFCVGTLISIIPEDSVAGDSVLGKGCKVDSGTKCDNYEI